MSDARRANIAAAIVILLAGGLSTVWVFLVPIFQAPDEPAHFDYAASIYTAHRLITLNDGSPDWIVNPYTKYLMRAADFDRIASGKHRAQRDLSAFERRRGGKQFEGRTWFIRILNGPFAPRVRWKLPVRVRIEMR